MRTRLLLVLLVLPLAACGPKRPESKPWSQMQKPPYEFNPAGQPQALPDNQPTTAPM